MDGATEFLMRHGVPVLFAAVFADQLGLPLPGLPLLLTAGALAGEGALHPAGAFALAVAAAVLGDFLWYEVGRRRGRLALALVCRVSLEPDACIGRTRAAFLRHGLRSLLFARFVPVLATVTSPLAGTLGVSRARFLLYDGLGALLWAGGYMGLGYAFSDQIETLAASAGRTGAAVAVGGLGALAAYLAYTYARRRPPATAPVAARCWPARCTLEAPGTTGGPPMRQVEHDRPAGAEAAPIDAASLGA